MTPVAAGADPGGTHVPVDSFAEVDKLAAELAALDQLGDARERARFLAARHPLPELESIEQSLRAQPYVQPRTAEQEANAAPAPPPWTQSDLLRKPTPWLDGLAVLGGPPHQYP